MGGQQAVRDLGHWPYEFVPSAGLEARTTAGQESSATDTRLCGQGPSR